MIDLIHSARLTGKLAASALPDAPVVPDPKPAPRRTRVAAAALLRRAADRLAPDPRRFPAQGGGHLVEH